MCSDFGCKSKQAVQAELIERVIKDKASIEEEMSKLKTDINDELQTVLKMLNQVSEGSSWREKMVIVKGQIEKLMATSK